jgi:flagellar assembly protein FliH
MSAIIKANDSGARVRPWAADLAELAGRDDPSQDWLEREAARIIATAKRQAEQIRRQAAAEGRREGRRAARRVLARRAAERWATLMPAMENAVREVRDTKQAWLSRWEADAVHVAVAIAERVVRRELAKQPDIPLALVREALELAAGSDQIRVCLNPADHQSLGPRVDAIARELAGLGSVEVVADAAVSPGGCHVETRHGVIDQRFEAQLARIEEELS